MNEWAVLAGLSCLVLPVCLGSLMWFLFSTSSARLTIIRWPHLSSDCFCLVAIRSKGHQLAWFLSAPCGLSCSTGPDWTSQGGFRSDSGQTQCTSTFISFCLHHICWCYIDKGMPSPKPIMEGIHKAVEIERSDSPGALTVTI